MPPLCYNIPKQKAFLAAGYSVDAMDGSKQLCERASAYIGIKAKEMWITSDVRPDRGEEKWLNIILKRV